MRYGGNWAILRIGLLAVLALTLSLALSPAYASAAETIKVDESEDAPLESGATSCESTSTNEGCTLRAAVELANKVSTENGSEAVTIEVPEGEYKETVGPDYVLLVEAGANVTIRGAGATKTIVDGSTRAAVFEVEDATLTLEDLRAQNGDEQEGGGVWVSEEAELFVERSTIAENSAEREGGGIYAARASSVWVKQSKIEDNFAGNHKGIGGLGRGEGGGIYAEPLAMVRIEDSSVSHNGAEIYGGGIFGDGNPAITIDNSSVSENTSRYGGGIYDEGGENDCDTGRAAHAHRSARPAIPEDEEGEGQLSIRKSTISKNVAGENDDGYGGGIYIAPSFGRECDLRAAPAATAALPSFLPEEDGLTVEQSTIAENVAGSDGGGDGGGIYEEGFTDPIINSTIAHNAAGDSGGGVFTNEGVTTLISDTIADNTTESAQTGKNIATSEDEEAIIELRDSIVAEEPGENEQNCSGEIVSLVPGGGYNLDYPKEAGSPDSCGLSEEDHDLLGVDPHFEGGLADHGGPTETIALASSSPAIGVVPLAEDCEESSDGPGSVDQRGEPRPGTPGEGCDIGAYEYQQPSKAPEVKAESKTEAKTEAKKEEGKQVLPVTVTSAVACASKRDIIIHIQNVKQFGIVSATVSIDGKHPRTLTGRHLSTGIDLKGLPKGTFTVDIVAHTKSGKTLHGKRVYHTCHTKLPGHSYLRL